MVDGKQSGTAPPDSARGHAPCRIDRWSPDGWATVRHYGDPALAEHALVEMRRREPDALLRLVRRTDPGPVAIDRPGPVGPGAHASASDPRTRRRAPTRRSAMVRVVGALGLVVLATLACIAAFSDPEETVTTPRSTASADTTAPSTTGAAHSSGADEPGRLAGTWAANEAECGTDSVAFLPGRELRAASGEIRAVSVTSYRLAEDGSLQVGYPGGGTAVYAPEGEGLRFVRARIADIQVTPQRQATMRRCADAALPDADVAEVQADTVAEAFRLAVRMGDDLAATLALARGLAATAPLPGSQSPLALALAYDRPVVVAKLLAAGANPDIRDAEGRTPLSRAVMAGRDAMVEALLAGGADPRRQDADGLQPLDHATARGDDALIDMLFAAGR